MVSLHCFMYIYFDNCTLGFVEGFFERWEIFIFSIKHENVMLFYMNVLQKNKKLQ